jgi:protein-tyrosine phosphatase
MTFERINLRLSNCDWNAAVCKTVDVLQEGGVVVVPTETVYGLAARLGDRQAVRQVIELKGRNAQHPFALAFPNIDAIEDICPEMSPLARRLARRCLPGSVSLVLDVPPQSMFWKLPQEIQQAVSLQSTICCRIPDHPLLLTVLGEINEPIVLTSANKTGCGESTNVDQIIADLGDGINLLLDDGSLTSPKPSTIVKINGNDYTILREGAIKSETIQRLAAFMILFVCANNTSQSPMAEYLCEHMLAEHLHCSPSTLEHRGIVVLSAGLSAIADAGHPASAHAAEVLKEHGLDLSKHRSLLLNETHIRFADVIFTMTRSHREEILSKWHNVDSRLNVLRTDGGDITDPKKKSASAIQSCAEQIREAIDQRLEEIVEACNFR